MLVAEPSFYSVHPLYDTRCVPVSVIPAYIPSCSIIAIVSNDEYYIYIYISLANVTNKAKVVILFTQFMIQYEHTLLGFLTVIVL